LFWQRADGSGAAERFGKMEQGQTPQAESWTPDGTTLIFLRRNNVGSTGLMALTPGADQKPRLVIPAPAGNPSLSPDGQWLAYQSPESGRQQIYVQPFPPNGTKYQVTPDGGSEPLWSP